MLDRGTTQDWFSSSEIVMECALAGLGGYLFVVHMLTAKRPFLQKAIFRDRNFVLAQVLQFIVGAILLASTALIPPFLQNLSGYTVTETGLLLGPRGFGTIAAMLLVGKVSNHIDPRILIGGLGMGYALDEALDLLGLGSAPSLPAAYPNLRRLATRFTAENGYRLIPLDGRPLRSPLHERLHDSARAWADSGSARVSR